MLLYVCPFVEMTVNLAVILKLQPEYNSESIDYISAYALDIVNHFPLNQSLILSACTYQDLSPGVTGVQEHLYSPWANNKVQLIPRFPG